MLDKYNAQMGRPTKQNDKTGPFDEVVDDPSMKVGAGPNLTPEIIKSSIQGYLESNRDESYNTPMVVQWKGRKKKLKVRRIVVGINVVVGNSRGKNVVHLVGELYLDLIFFFEEIEERNNKTYPLPPPFQTRPTNDGNHYPGQDEPKANPDAKIEDGQVAVLAVRGPIPRSADGSTGMQPDKWEKMAKVIVLKRRALGNIGCYGVCCTWRLVLGGRGELGVKNGFCF